jgi:hypothetical protein
MIAEIGGSIGELGRIAAGKIFEAEIEIARAVAQHVMDDRQRRSGNGDKCFLRPRRVLRPDFAIAPSIRVETAPESAAMRGGVLRSEVAASHRFIGMYTERRAEA